MSATSDKKILWYGPIWEHAGYATHSRELVKQLLKSIPSLRIIPTTDPPPTTDPELLALRPYCVPFRESIGADIVIQCTPTTAYRLPAKYSILLTTIESARPHDQLVRRLTLHDEIWLPSKFNRRILPRWLKRRMPVLVMPEGADADTFKPLSHATDARFYLKKVYTFHSDWSDRKGIKELIAAWLNVYKLMPPARLLLITKKGMSTEADARSLLLKELLRMLPAGHPISDFNIRLELNDVSAQQLNELYNLTYCGVLPTKGEAWSLFPNQLAAAGRPCITTNFSGHLHYLNKRNAYLIRVKSFGPILDGKTCAVDFYNFVPFALPDQHHLEKLFLFTYNHPQDVQRRGDRARADVLKHWTWNQAAQHVLRRLHFLCNRL